MTYLQLCYTEAVPSVHPIRLEPRNFPEVRNRLSVLAEPKVYRTSRGKEARIARNGRFLGLQKLEGVCVLADTGQCNCQAYSNFRVARRSGKKLTQNCDGAFAVALFVLDSCQS